MQRGGVDAVRVDVPWYEVEAAPEAFSWERLNRIVLAAAEREIEVLPFVWGTPGWLRDDAALPPIDSAAQRTAWQRFMRALALRYGPDGEIWTDHENPNPVRRWQIWNEPNFPRFYQPNPSPRGFARLVRLSSDALKSVDPDARVVLGGLAPVLSGPKPTVFLRDLYRVPDIERHFDAVALHPYSRGVGRLRHQLKAIRGVIRRADVGRTPLLVTELGWASRLSPGTRDGGAVRGTSGQAKMVRRAFGLLERHRRPWRIHGAYWFAWQDAAVPEANCAFCQYAGLFSYDRDPKPAWATFRKLARP